MWIFEDRKMSKFCDTFEALIKHFKIKVITWTWILLEPKFYEMLPWTNLGDPRSAVPEILI